MVNAHRKEILDALDKTPSVQASEHLGSGQAAAQATVDLMRKTFKALPPADMLRDYLAARKKNDDPTEMFWKNYGPGTIEAMQDGTHLLAVLWESAWVAGGGEGKKPDTSALKPETAMAICAPADFLPSCSIVEVGKFLAGAAATSKPKKNGKKK
jgi:hypothetical protein